MTALALRLSRRTKKPHNCSFFIRDFGKGPSGPFLCFNAVVGLRGMRTSRWALQVGSSENGYECGSVLAEEQAVEGQRHNLRRLDHVFNSDPFVRTVCEVKDPWAVGDAVVQVSDTGDMFLIVCAR